VGHRPGLVTVGFFLTALGFILYVVAQSRGPDLLDNILGKDFGGVLVSDCLAIYDDAIALQQKCYAHHHKVIRKAEDLHPQQGKSFLCEEAETLRAAVAL
jgi:transposase